MVQLTPIDEQILAGKRGRGPQFAMQTLMAVAEMYDARRFVDIEWAHVAAAYCHSQANIDFARKLADWKTSVAVPTTLTACSFDPRSPTVTDDNAVALIEAYRSMGCDPVMTCAPYQAREEPTIGTHLAWCESSAVVYANSVLGARTNRYPEFIDMCAAIVGRVPECGLHVTENRRATVVVELQELPDAWYADGWLFQSLGILLGQRCGDAVPAIVGLPGTTTTEQLRGLGSAAASSGSVSMFHAVGITPEAPSLEVAALSGTPHETFAVTPADIEDVAAGLDSRGSEPVSAVCVGAPHFSVDEFNALVSLLEGRSIVAGVKFIAATSAAVLAEIDQSGVLATLQDAGVEFVTGRCTYYRPFVADLGSHVMTNSAKWAWYAPSDLDVQVTFASLVDCVAKACGDG